MFEKEAKKWVKENTETEYKASYGEFSIEPSAKKSFIAGAEFGYNKANKEIKLLKETHRQSIGILVEQIEELHKANEWHYVKDGDLPKEFDKPYLCKVNSHFEVGYFMAYKEQPWHFDEYYLDNEDVIAWKEIVLPELPKESE